MFGGSSRARAMPRNPRPVRSTTRRPSWTRSVVGARPSRLQLPVGVERFDGDRIEAALDARPRLVAGALGADRAGSAEVTPAADRAGIGRKRGIGVRTGGHRLLGRLHVGGGLLGPAD